MSLGVKAQEACAARFASQIPSPFFGVFRNQRTRLSVFAEADVLTIFVLSIACRRNVARNTMTIDEAGRHRRLVDISEALLRQTNITV